MLQRLFGIDDAKRGLWGQAGPQIRCRDAKPLIKDTRNKMRNTKNRILAMPAAARAIPPKPKTAATIAITRNMADHRSIDPPSELALEQFSAGEGASRMNLRSL
jgi:hypothetical protein